MFIQTKLKWLLSHNHIIAEMTGRGLTTVQCITQLVCKVIVTSLWSNFVFFVMFSSLFEAAIFSLWLTFRSTGTRNLWWQLQGIFFGWHPTSSPWQFHVPLINKRCAGVEVGWHPVTWHKLDKTITFYFINK